MKKKSIFLMAFFVAGFFLTVGVGKASADLCTQTFKDGSYACLNTADANQVKNIFDVDTACQTGYCSGSNAVKCCRTTCNEDELCKDLVVQSGKLYPPAGFACVDRGVCGQNRGCCKSTTTGAANTNAAATPAFVPGSSTSFVNPLKFSTVEDFLGVIMSAIQKIIVVLALIFILVGAVMILASAGNSGMVENGKKSITMALVGLAIGVAAPSILKELAGILGWGGTAALTGLTLSEIAIRVLNFLLGTMGILALVMMVIGSIMYITSAGDDHRMEEGKNIFKYALLGLFFAMVSMILVRQIALFFSTTPSQSQNSSAVPTNGTTGTLGGNTNSTQNIATPIVCNGSNIGTLCNFSGAVTNLNGVCNSAGNCIQEVLPEDCEAYATGSVVNKTKTNCCGVNDYACLNS